MNLALLFLLPLAADPGAEVRSMFFDPTSGVKLMTRKADPPPPAAPPKPVATTKPPLNRMPTPPSVPVREVSSVSSNPRNTGLRYWIELLKPNGELQRVTANTVFHSGEEVRLHIETNVDGRLSIHQKSPEGKMDRLFPDPRVNAGANIVRANRDTVIPSSSARFVFDSQAGTENLTLIFVPLSGSAATEGASTGTTLVAEERNLQERVEAASRSLFLAVDARGPDTAAYAINTNWDARLQTSGEVAINIQLIHR